MYAVINVPGRQIKAEIGQTLRVDYLPSAREGEKIVFDKVLFLSDGQSVRVGTPFVAARVHATVVAHGRDKKIIVFKKKRRVDYHKKYGHRQRFTTVRIESIEV
jgi:large subunit ribosomal protein L21